MLVSKYSSDLRAAKALHQGRCSRDDRALSKHPAEGRSTAYPPRELSDAAMQIVPHGLRRELQHDDVFIAAERLATKKYVFSNRERSSDD